MNHASLFSGIGGFDLAAQWMGWENVFHCEINPFCQRVLKYYWHKSISYEDIKTTDFTIHRGTIDVLTGGFPCQPYSQAGKRLGKEDDRHLWPEMLRAIREIQPRWVVGENVRGLTNWNGGLVFDEVQADLEAISYEVTPFLLPACAVNAPHRRYRIWFVAYNSNARVKGVQFGGKNGVYEPTGKLEGRLEGLCGNELIANSNQFNGNLSGLRTGEIPQFEKAGIFEDTSTDSIGNGQPGKEHGQTERGRVTKTSVPNDWENFPTQPPVCVGNDGLPSGLVGITVSKHRNESIKGYGNAVVPQVVLQIFKTIEAYEHRITRTGQTL